MQLRWRVVKYGRRLFSVVSVETGIQPVQRWLTSSWKTEQFRLGSLSSSWAKYGPVDGPRSLAILAVMTPTVLTRAASQEVVISDHFYLHTES